MAFTGEEGVKNLKNKTLRVRGGKKPLLTDQQLEKPEAEIDVWFFDEHRVGLKPILRKVWSPVGERPIA
ncbi:hypothetical protein H6G50_22325, partial [Oscillatoria sp. FACHB-1406]|nr:hypothetical protein [Oscillatoria sp. FACHB-1406]